jgi:MFS family permease
VAELVPAERRGIAFGLTVSAQSMASAMGPLMAAGITASYGMRPIFLVTAAFFALNFLSASLSFRRKNEPFKQPT